MVAHVPPQASVEATNHVLAHLSDRKDARFIKRDPQADAIALSLAQDDWKPNRGNIRPSQYKKLIRRLIDEKDYRLVFSERLAVLFVRGDKEKPQASLSKELVEFLK